MGVISAMTGINLFSVAVGKGIMALTGFFMPRQNGLQYEDDTFRLLGSMYRASKNVNSVYLSFDLLPWQLDC